MSPLVDFLFRAVMALVFLALVASVVAGRVRSSRPAPAHDPRTCMACVVMRHPSNRGTRQALTAIPRQDRGGEL